MPRAITRCPQCREPVSPFAAGCAICGADLEAARAQPAARRRPALSRVAPGLPRLGPAPGVRVDWVQLALAVILALAAAPIGFLLSLYWALQRHRAGEPVMVAVMLGTAALSAAAFFDPAWFWSRLLNV